MFRAPGLAALAAAIGVDAGSLEATVARFNQHARAGRDEDFRRGDSAYDRYYGDPRVRPNPNLAPLASPPYYAAKIVPGDLGTKGGLRTDARARVLRADGTPITGLYAAGNASASVMGHSYAGAGATIGPAMTFGYLAAQDMAPQDRAARDRAAGTDLSGEDQAAGGDAGAGGHQDGAVAGHLVDRCPADLADRLGDAVHPVDIGLTELATVGVQRQAAA